MKITKHLPTEKFPWRSQKATTFRNFFRSRPLNYNPNKANEEHQLESALLTEFSKTKSTGKSILGIQPVLFPDLSGQKSLSKRFQMPTPLSASSAKKGVVSISPKGGGIDILARRGKGKVTLVVIELKDENAPGEGPKKAILQAISYSVFIRELLRSQAANGQEWYCLYGFTGKLPKKLTIKCAVAMPSIMDIECLKGQKLDLEGDTIELHCICVDYYDDNGCTLRCSDGF